MNQYEFSSWGAPECRALLFSQLGKPLQDEMAMAEAAAFRQGATRRYLFMHSTVVLFLVGTRRLTLGWYLNPSNQQVRA
jgi:hypothetical protein